MIVAKTVEMGSLRQVLGGLILELRSIWMLHLGC